MAVTELAVGEAVIRLERGDITTTDADAIVNAANPGLMGGGGVDGAIHRVGGPEILDECVRIVAERGRLPAGQAVITTAGRLLAGHLIHTVGPVWAGGLRHEAETLAGAYQESLALAREKGLGTVAFPSISTGAYGYPVTKAAPVALEAVRDFLADDRGSVREVRFVLFDDFTLAAYTDALSAITYVAPIEGE